MTPGESRRKVRSSYSGKQGRVGTKLLVQVSNQLFDMIIAGVMCDERECTPSTTGASKFAVELLR